MRPKREPSVVVIGGGTGIFSVLSALAKEPVRVTAVVSMADDGGSTGMLRDQYGVLPPGDIRKAIVALSRSSGLLRDLFNYRFRSGSLAGHIFGNVFLSAIERVTGSFPAAVREASRLLGARGSVLPVTLDRARLIAKLSDGRRINGERNIDAPRGRRAPIADAWLAPRAAINPAVRLALRRADLIVIGPGDLWSSIVPNVLVRGVPQAIRGARAPVAYVGNLMTKRGETDGFGASDFVAVLERYLGPGAIDYAIFNSARPRSDALRRYARAGGRLVDVSGIPRSGAAPRYILADVLDRGILIRHAPNRKLSRILLGLLAGGAPSRA